MTLSEKYLTKFFQGRKKKTSRGSIVPVVPAGMVLIRTDFPDVDKILSICEFCPLQESNNRIISLLVDGRKTSLNHSWTWFDVNLPDLEAILHGHFQE